MLGNDVFVSLPTEVESPFAFGCYLELSTSSERQQANRYRDQPASCTDERAGQDISSLDC